MAPRGTDPSDLRDDDRPEDYVVHSIGDEIGRAIARSITKYPKSWLWMIFWSLLGIGSGGFAGMAAGIGTGGILLILGHVMD